MIKKDNLLEIYFPYTCATSKLAFKLYPMDPYFVMWPHNSSRDRVVQINIFTCHAGTITFSIIYVL